MTQFATFGLPETLLKALEKIGFTEPTPIQAQAIPFALQGRDVLGSASTGTGKTAAFALPMITHLIHNPESAALIMTPTRELATQVLATIMPLLIMHREIRTACLIGGESMGRQFAQLAQNPRIIVGTPGRINDHLSRRSLKLEKADFLILDETDRMLDMGFGVQIEKIIPLMAKKRQTLMFSATLPQEIVRMSSRYLTNPERVSVDSTTLPPSRIKQEQVQTTEGEKYMTLTQQLDKRTGSVIVFVKTKHGADRLATRLSRADYAADAIHGNLQQRRRDRVIQGFRDQKYRILVATDVAARGLDIPHIEHVINYDLPQCPEDYIHRIGRTARAGAEGEAVNLLTPADGAKWNAILRLINPSEARAENNNQRGGGRNSRNYKGRNGGGGGSSRQSYSRNKPWKDGDESRSSGRSQGERPRYEGKKEWKPRDNAAEGSSGSERPRYEGKKEWKPRERTEGGDRPRFEGKKEWKPRDRSAGGEDRPRGDWKGPRNNRFDRNDRSDKPRYEGKKEWKPRDNAGGNSERPRFEGKKEWKPREDRASGGEGRRHDRPERSDRPRFEGKKEWKPREDNASGDAPRKKDRWRNREGNPSADNRQADGAMRRKSHGGAEGKKEWNSDRRPAGKGDFGKKKPFRFKEHTRKPARKDVA